MIFGFCLFEFLFLFASQFEKFLMTCLDAQCAGSFFGCVQSADSSFPLRRFLFLTFLFDSFLHSLLLFLICSCMLDTFSVRTRSILVILNALSDSSQPSNFRIPASLLCCLSELLPFSPGACLLVLHSIQRTSLDQSSI